MNFHRHSTNNMILGAPKDMENCENLPATMMVDEESGQTTIASFWTPNQEELEALRKGGSVVLYVFGTMHPPVSIGVTESK